jgi:hypothetical protein
MLLPIAIGISAHPLGQLDQEATQTRDAAEGGSSLVAHRGISLPRSNPLEADIKISASTHRLWVLGRARDARHGPGTRKTPESPALIIRIPKQINVELPVQMQHEKFFFRLSENHDSLCVVPPLIRGRFAIVTNVGSGMRWTQSIVRRAV